MNSDWFLNVLGADPNEWADRWGLIPVTEPCSECGKRLTTTIPFVQEQLRGLRCPACKCGNEKTPFCVVRDYRYGDFFTGGLGAGPRKPGVRRTSRPGHLRLLPDVRRDG